MDPNLKALADAVGKLIAERWFSDREQRRSTLREPIAEETCEQAAPDPHADVGDGKPQACLTNKRNASR